MATIPASELTPDQLDAILQDIRDTAGGPDGSVVKIAKRHNLSSGTLRRLAEKHGLADAWSTGAGATAEAVAARTTAAASRRSELQHQLLDDVDQLRARLFEDVPIWSGGLAGIEKTYIASGPGDWRNTMTAIGIAVDKVIQLTRLENENSGTGQATGLLEQFEQELRVAREEREAEGTTS